MPAQWFSVVLIFISIIALFEMVVISGVKERYLLLFLALVCVVPLYFKTLFVFTGYLLLAPLIFIGYKILKGDSIKEGINEDILKGICVLFFSIIFIILPLYYLSLLKETGYSLPFVLLLAVWASDTCAYLFGKKFGKKKLVPHISPKKTYEGLMGAMVGSMVVILFAGRTMGMGMLEAVIIGALTGILAQTGDILESAGKRVCTIKDSSNLIPGHGGILDRMDSFIFTAPFLYHYMTGVKI